MSPPRAIALIVKSSKREAKKLHIFKYGASVHSVLHIFLRHRNFLNAPFET